MKLEEICSHCDGYGQSYEEPDYNKMVPCPECKGRKTVPTEAGKELLEFIKKFAGEIK